MYRERKTWIAYLACVPWGLIGLHKFYLRQPVLGTLYFFTAGFFVIGWLYDLVNLPDQVDRCNDKQGAARGLVDMLEDEIEDLEDEIQHLREKLSRPQSDVNVEALKERITELESQLARAESS